MSDNFDREEYLDGIARKYAQKKARGRPHIAARNKEEVKSEEVVNEGQKAKEAVAAKIMTYIKDKLIIAMPYFNRAILKMPDEFYVPKKLAEDEYGGFATDTRKLYIDADKLIGDFKKNPVIPTRLLLHTVFHCLYKHSYSYNRMNTDLWDFACDVASEMAIIDLNISSISEPLDHERRVTWAMIAKKVEKPSAEKIYEYMKTDPVAAESWLKFADLYKRDCHKIWKYSGLIKQDGEFITSTSTTDLDQWGDEWDRVFVNVKKDKELIEHGRGLSISTVTDVLGRIDGDDNDYSDFLREFAAIAEEVSINPDEFDYIYYTYGMNLYKNMPLIEPLEYRERLKIYDFVIAIDTSGSCKGSTVKNFLKRTYSILKNSEIFGSRMNVHIIYCDNVIQEDIKIETDEQFEKFISNVTVKGAGGTDFRPVFDYVGELKKKGEFSNLQGLIYLTDGLGIFPEKEPEFKTAFIVMPLEDEIPQLPLWAKYKLVSRAELENARAIGGYFGRKDTQDLKR